jgi:RNA polymerase sigma-70 factor (ECF subfamily)
MTEPTAVDVFDEFYRAHWPRLAGTLRLVSGGTATADDVAQEAFTLAWMRWERVSKMERPAGWLYTTAFRLQRRRMARDARRPQADCRDLALPADVTDRVSLERALATLPLHQRQAIVARHVLGLDGPSAAELLGMRPANFRQVLSRGCRSLRLSPELLERW